MSNHAQGSTTYEVPEGHLENVRLLGFDDAVASALMLHGRLPMVSVGWDVILTDDGPQFIEGNIPHGVMSVDQKGCYEMWRQYYRLTGFVKV